MGFNDIQKIEKPDYYLDVAFNNAKLKAEVLATKRYSEKLVKEIHVETTRLKVVTQTLMSYFENILRQFPRIDELTPFYNELVKCTLDYDSLKKALGAINWCLKQTKEFHGIYNSKIRRSKDISSIKECRRAFYGRISSLVKQMKPSLEVLESARKIMREYPSIKGEYFTVAIAGFPNVGKSTLLSRITSAKPEIREYAFTTKALNFGYIGKQVQLIDTPGSLDRFEKMNSIEKQAELAIKYCAHLIVYIFDLTEPYPLDLQKKLLSKLKKHNKETILYLSKTDILDKKQVDDFKREFKVITDSEELKEILVKQAEKFNKKE